MEICIGGKGGDDLLSEIISAPQLSKGQVWVWTTELDNVTETRRLQLAGSLSRDENQRAIRFRFERDRNRFVVCRGVLREILGTYLQIDPEKVDFNYGPQGKPYLKEPSGYALGPLYFNLSHSADQAIYALGSGEVGVDLEYVRPIPEMQALIDQYFSIDERSAFRSVSPEQKLKAFYNCWTRKEAYVKACGDGLLISLDQFDVSIEPELPARLLRVQGTPGDKRLWSLHSFDLSTEAVAALVCPRDSEPHFCGAWTRQSHD